MGLAAETTLANDNQQSIYPGINFTCSGSITSWSVLVRRFTDFSEEKYPDLQLWREENAEIYTRVGNTTLSGRITNQDGILEHVLDSPLEFEAGDFLGIFQPSGSLKIQLRGGVPVSCYIEMGDAPYDWINVTASALNQSCDYPLVTIVTSEYDEIAIAI